VRIAELPLQNRQHAIQGKEKDNTAGKEGEENGNEEWQKTGKCEKRERSRKEGGRIKGKTRKKQIRTRAHCRVAAAKPAACDIIRNSSRKNWRTWEKR